MRPAAGPNWPRSEQAEIDVIESFLPQQLSEAETSAAIEAIKVELAPSSLKDMGKVIGGAQGEAWDSARHEQGERAGEGSAGRLTATRPPVHQRLATVRRTIVMKAR